MQPAPSHTGPERRQAPRYRVTVHMGGLPQFYRQHTSNVDALAYQRQMRDIYRRAGLHVWVKKERLPQINALTTIANYATTIPTTE